MFSFPHNKINIWIIEGISLFFILLFFYAGSSKLIEQDNFYNNIHNSPILGSRIIASGAEWAVPLAELVIALLLSWPKTRLKGMITAIALLFIFTGYIIGILFFSPYIPCSCGGVIGLLSWKQHLLFNLVCIILAALNISLIKTKKKWMKELKVPF